jgi:HEAT repeat protein
LRKLLASEDSTAKYHAAVALGRIGDGSDETIRALVEAVTGSDGHVQRAAIAAVRALNVGPEHVLPIVQEVLASDDPSVAAHALEAIVDQGAAAVPFLKEALKRTEIAYLACTAISEIGPDAAGTVPELVDLLQKTKHSQLQIQALIALAHIGPDARSAAPTIKPLLATPNDATVPVAAAFALGSIGAADADAELKKALTRDEPFVQMGAAWALAKLHPDDQAAMRQAVEKLTQGLKSDDSAIRTAAAKGLSLLAPPPELVAPALIALGNDPDPEVSANVVSALASLGEAVVPRAARALQNPEGRKMAVRVLTQLGPQAKDAVGPLAEAMSEADPEFRASVHFALASIGPDAAPATEALARGLTAEDERVRHSALYALRMIGPGAKAAVPSLVQLTEGEASFDALAAAWALASIAPTDASVAAKAVPVLARGLSHSDDHIRFEGVEALAAFGAAAKPAAEALARAAKEDRSPLVREAAEAALAKIAP